MLIGKRHAKPPLVYIAIAIVLVTLILTLAWSHYQRTDMPATAPLHQDR
jgi:hypothetical protein